MIREEQFKLRKRKPFRYKKLSDEQIQRLKQKRFENRLRSYKRYLERKKEKRNKNNEKNMLNSNNFH